MKLIFLFLAISISIKNYFLIIEMLHNFLTKIVCRNFSISSPLQKSVYLRNIPKNLNMKDLISFFSGYGEISNIRIAQNNYAFVDFSNDDDAHKAVKELMFREIKGSPIWLEMAKPQKDGPVDWDAYKKMFKQYSPEKFVKTSDRLFKKGDWIQAAENSYLAAVYCIKFLALDQQIHLTSHDEIRKFCDFLVFNETFRCVDNGLTSIILGHGYSSGEELHRFSLGKTCDSIEQIGIYMKKVKKMVKAFRTIKPETVKEALKDSKMWERYREKPGETSLSEDRSELENDDGVSFSTEVVDQEMESTNLSTEPIHLKQMQSK
uniref:RRM domain-containing protein n=1 Tax=Meloidogyne enterolobii TaxID=390850 RepID=A0A6V7V0L9_MELEN|nr:unnamed protein product [Meloidogyne enterolobii]